MAKSNRLNVYLRDPDEIELWNAIQAIPKGARGAAIRDILRKSLVPKIEPEKTEELKQNLKWNIPEVDREMLRGIPVYQGDGWVRLGD